MRNTSVFWGFLTASGAALISIAPEGTAWGQNPGPGVPALTYPGNQLFKSIAVLNGNDQTPYSHAFVTMHNGYLFLLWSADGGCCGIGGFAFVNIANPYDPQTIFTTYHNPPFEDGGPQSAGLLREGHAFTFRNDNYACLAHYRGLQFWNFNNIGPPSNTPALVGQIVPLPGMAGGDYDQTPWWHSWQGGRYVYVSGSSTGLHIVDASNPAAPVMVNRGAGKPNPIPNSQTGGFRIGALFVVGNLMVVVAVEEGNGMATLDISDPANPVLLRNYTFAPGYSAMVNGNRLFAALAIPRIYSIASDGSLALIGTGPPVSEAQSGYAMFQDNFVHFGASTVYEKLNIQNPSSIPAPSTFRAPDSDTDLDFVTPIGNLAFVSDDHYAGTYIVPHQSAPDTTGPVVNMAVPWPNAVNQALMSRVGLTFTDSIDLRTVNNSTVIVRPFGGAALTGKYSHESGIVNFWPDSNLQADTTYEIVVPAGGVKDWAGNVSPSSFTSLFSTGPQIETFDVTCQLVQNPTYFVGQAVPFDVVSCGGVYSGQLTYSWNFGDGSPATPFSSNASASHAYVAPGRYTVTLTVTNGTSQRQFTMIQTIVYPPTPAPPAAASSIILDAARQRVWLVNPDADTVTAINTVNLTKAFEVPVGADPRTLGLAPDGTLWVANKKSSTISILNGNTGALLQTLVLPRGSLPYAVAFSPTGNFAYVTLEGSGSVQRWNPAIRSLINSVSVGNSPRGLAISHDGQRIFVTCFMSPVDHGRVFELGGAPLNIVRIFSLAIDPGPDTESSGRGVPNYLVSVTVSPDGRRAWIPSKKDNTQRGLVRDGLPLTHESTVRAIASQIDLLSNNEVLSARKDFNDRAFPSAVAFSPLGEFAYVTTLASNTLEVLDPSSSGTVTAITDVGLAPLGVVLSADGQRLFIHNYMSRDVRVYDITDVGFGNQATLLATIDTVDQEKLPPTVLLGKQIFYNAADDRMSRENYISCAVCHLDGESDGRVWDFTDRGEGLRNTTNLMGRSGMKHGPVHWSANFDEMQDFEHDMRNAFLGTGFMSDAAYNTGTRNTPLGDPKAGVSAELDSLAAYVTSLTRVHDSPHRNPDGSMTAAALRGEALFRSPATGCTPCHVTSRFTDSSLNAAPYLLHDVGTLKPTSGQRLGGPLTGIDTPTLKGLWQTAPYLHDGSAPTLMDVITTANPANQHGNTTQLSLADRSDLVAYLLQVDNTSLADFNGDNRIDLTDLGLFDACKTGPDIPSANECLRYDLDYDLDVDLNDFGLLQRCTAGPALLLEYDCTD